MGLSVFLVLGGGGVNHVISSWVLGTAVSVVVGYFLVSKHISPLSFNKSAATKLLKEAFPTGALLIVSTVYNRADILILQYFHDTRDVGIYGMAYKVYDTAVFGASYLMNAMFPLISGLYSAGQITNSLRAYLRRAFWTLLLFGGLVSMLVFVTAPYLPLVFHGRFDFSVWPLRVLSFALVFSYLNHLIGYTLIALSRQKIALAVAVTALVFNLSLNFLLVPRFSYLASSYLTVATEALVLLLSGFVILRTLSNAK